MKILVVRLDHLGDLLLTTPLVRALSIAGHAVDVLVRESLQPVFDRSPYVEECYAVEQVAPSFPGKWWQLSRWLRSTRHDAVILAYARESRLCLASAFSGSPRRIAMWAGAWGRLTGHECLPSHMLDNPRPVSEILLSCSRALGASDQGIKPDFFLGEEEVSSWRALLPAGLQGRPLIGIHPGSAGNACNLPSAIYGQVAEQLLRETDCGLLVTGTPNETNLLSSWPIPVLESERVWQTMGKLDLRQLAAAIAEMKVYVCSSTGPLHIASAVSTRTVSPFCPAVPLNAAIWGNVGAPAIVLEPQTCPRRSGKTACCDFGGQISARQVATEVCSFLATGT
ncbi:MAG: glycosyltransferase family 9 protein [Verrucomicrobiota bacterium]|nr:glycosyltransferase family 9 protein [Verrucomicrobiota bacterium]